VWLLPVGTTDGPDWVIIGAIYGSPANFPGDVTWGAWTSAPWGRVLADGTQYNTTGITAALFAAIGYTYGGSGAVFRVPDLRGKVPVMAGAGVAVGGGALTTRSLGQAGGDEQMQQHDHANTTAESANHTHTVPVGTFGQISNYANEVSGGLGGTGSAIGPSGRGTPPTSIDSNGHIHGTTVSGTGTGGNMQPFLVLNAAIWL
jgi:microcystin-dependent protein